MCFYTSDPSPASSSSFPLIHTSLLGLFYSYDVTYVVYACAGALCVLITFQSCRGVLHGAGRQ